MQLLPRTISPRQNMNSNCTLTQLSSHKISRLGFCFFHSGLPTFPNTHFLCGCPRPLASSFTSGLLRQPFPERTIIAGCWTSHLHKGNLNTSQQPGLMFQHSVKEKNVHNRTDTLMTKYPLVWGSSSLCKKGKRHCSGRHLLSVAHYAIPHPLVALKNSHIFMWLLQRENFWLRGCKG